MPQRGAFDITTVRHLLSTQHNFMYAEFLFLLFYIYASLLLKMPTLFVLQDSLGV